MTPLAPASRNLLVVPPNLPVPEDDGAAKHLTGRALPSVLLRSTNGIKVDLSAQQGLVVVFVYPRTGRPGQPPLVPDWDAIPGARGCTPQTCSFRDLNEDFRVLGAKVFGLSTQGVAYQREMANRLHLPFPVLSDSRLRLTRALSLPTMTVAGKTLLRRMAWVQRAGVIAHVFYPVFPPDRNASQILSWLRNRKWY